MYNIILAYVLHNKVGLFDTKPIKKYLFQSPGEYGIAL